MAVLTWVPKSFDLFFQLRDFFPCLPGFLGRVKVEMALIEKGCGPFRANLVTLCVLQTGGGLEPQANGETPQVAVVVRPGR